jgi:hypothetical protein
MGLIIKKETENQSVPVFVTIIEDYPGGGTLSQTGLVVGETVKAGALVKFDESTRLVSVLKTASITENATNTATDYKISKGSGLVVGDNFSAVVGGKAYPITVIDKTNADYDLVSVGTTLGVALVVGDVVFQSSATGASAGALMYDVNGILRNSAVVGNNEMVAVVRRGTTYERRLPSPVPSAVKTALQGLIVFSKQF